MSIIVVLSLVLTTAKGPQVRDMAVIRDVATCEKLRDLIMADKTRPANVKAICRVVRETSA